MNDKYGYSSISRVGSNVQIPAPRFDQQRLKSSRNLPILFLLPYLIVGFLLFLVAPFDWRIQNTLFLCIYFSAILAVFYTGFQLPLSKLVGIAPQVKPHVLILAGTLSSVVLLVPATLLYSGKYPWQFMEMIADQSEAYSNYLERLYQSNQADRAPVAILRTILHPIVFSVLPITLLNWRKLNNWYRACILVVIACMLITSLARGTDRESFDLLVFVGSCALVMVARGKVELPLYGHRQRPKNTTKRLVFAAVFISLTTFFMYVFIERKLGRFGGNATALCIGSEVDICLTHAARVADYLSEWQIFAIGITAGYMSQGYYGLSLAFDLDFNSTYFTAFSPLVARIYEGISGDTTLYMSSYTFRLRALGWSDEYAWSTLMIWFANEVGFLGALVVLFLFSILFGAAWRDAVLAKDDRAAIVFVMLFLMFVYLPANNQIGQTLDLSFAFLFWLFRWRYLKIKFRSI